MSKNLKQMLLIPIDKIKENKQKKNILKQYNPYQYSISDSVYKYYTHMVKGNREISKDIAIKKLNRNIYLSHRVNKNYSESRNTYYYGKLRIVVDEHKKQIVFLENMKRNTNFHRDKELYRILNAAYDL